MPIIQRCLAAARWRMSWAGRVISLPMHPYLSERDQDRVIAAVRRALDD